MEYTKEYIVAEYKKLKQHLGGPPSSKVFFAETGIHKRYVEKIFGSNSYSKLATECGDIANEFFKQKSDLDEILLNWGNLARSLGKLPTTADWAFNNNSPSADGIRRSHNLKWIDLPYKFLEFHSNESEWDDVIVLIPPKSANGNILSANIPRIEGLTFEYLKYIPPVIQDFLELSTNDEKSLEFEKETNLIFKMLGFEVDELGQGTGRNPDGIAKENQYRYAILLDSKSRKSSYIFGTEDRKFIEYINKYSELLSKGGYTKQYLLLVSSRFDSVSAISLKNIKIETGITTSLLEARLLLKMLAIKIQAPRLFNLKKFQELLIEDGEITERKVDKFIAGLK
ncbi:MAG TPA: hypothetical protein VFE32_19295 [Puia sp.]|nr:hypothetical protein [Puia sp.]